MITLPEYAYSAGSGAFIIMGADFITRDQPWYAVIAFGAFLLSIWLVRLQPSNISNGVIVRRSALTVYAYVNNRDIEWCGTKHLHDMHEWSNLPVSTDDMAVCLGHECHCPESHMQRIGHE